MTHREMPNQCIDEPLSNAIVIELVRNDRAHMCITSSSGLQRGCRKYTEQNKQAGRYIWLIKTQEHYNRDVDARNSPTFSP